MSQTPRMTDRHALIRNRQRAVRNPVLFLHETVLEEVQDRLMLVNKTFTDIAIVTPYPQVWQGAFPEATFVADTDVLEMTEGAYDLVIHALALHWADDPVGQLIQCRRALRPDGLFLGFTLGGETLHELRASLGQAEIEVTGGLSPRIAPMGEIRDLGGLLQRAGMTLPVADSIPLSASYQSPLHLMHELRAMGEANALSNRLRRPTRRAVLLRAIEIYADSFASDEGRVPATFELITLTGWSPDESQPQPLRPGSAAQRLADALGTTETPLKD